MKRVCIIGGGIAGLSCGTFLLKNNFDVTIYEKNPYAGGFLTTWKRQGAIIDGCMHWMLGTKEGTGFNTLWKEVGGLGNAPIYHPDTFCAIEYNGEVFHFYRDLDLLEKEFYKYSLDDDEEIATLFEALRSMGVQEMPTSLAFELMKPDDFKVDRNVIRKCRNYMKLNLHEMSLLFHSPMLRFAFDHFLLNRHFQAFNALQTLSNFSLGNNSIPVGCSKSIQDGMIERFTSLGGKFIVNSPVEEIVVENGTATGVKIKGERIPFDIVVSGCDLHYTESALLKGRMNTFKDFDENKKEYPTYSFCIASFKTKRDFSKDDIQTVKSVEPFDICGLGSDVISIRHYGYDKTLISSDGYTTIQVCLTTYEHDYEILKNMAKEEYKNFKKQLGAFYKSFLEEEYKEEFILIDVLTPLTYERYNNAYKGTFQTYAYGAKKPMVLASHRVKDIHNLYYCNQWSMLPGGTPIAVVSGKFCAEVVCYDLGLEYHL